MKSIVFTWHSSADLYLGIDLSTQSCKGIVIDDGLVVCYSANVNFDLDLPDYNTTNGVHYKGDGVVVSPTLMWVEATDLLFERLRQSNCPMNQIVSISVSGQQHGSVYWNAKSIDVLSHMNPEESLKDQLKECFAINESPIWMDTSTSNECKHLEEVIGDAQTLAAITGSRAYERFTGNQIAKIAKECPEAYNSTVRISLVSSFVPTLLTGVFSGIDLSDGSGMNLLDVKTKAWSKQCLNACAPGLLERLGDPVKSHTVVGTLASYFVKKYEMNERCVIVCGSGDNPCSLIGLRLCEEGDIAVSMGTSNTIFGLSSSFIPSLEGHVFVSPTNDESFFTMLCFMNGDIPRSQVCKQYANGDWNRFSTILHSTPAGNHNHIIIQYNQPEITPHKTQTGVFHFNAATRERIENDTVNAEEACRGIIESQFLSMRLHLEKIGFTQFHRLVATGGSSTNMEILQILSDIFQIPVFTIDCKDSAAIGAAIRACRGYLCQETHRLVSFSEMFQREGIDSPYKLACSPNPKNAEVYMKLLESLDICEQSIL